MKYGSEKPVAEKPESGKPAAKQEESSAQDSSDSNDEKPAAPKTQPAAKAAKKEESSDVSSVFTEFKQETCNHSLQTVFQAHGTGVVVVALVQEEGKILRRKQQKFQFINYSFQIHCQQKCGDQGGTVLSDKKDSWG